uniref:DUF1618 domain-containing protein n=1 Tax=Oryza glumipatula TaxID=40148 RepID=A0A0E0AGH5_9ORYZ
MALQLRRPPPPQNWIQLQIVEEEEVRTPFWIPPPTHPLPDPDPPYPEWILLHGKAYLHHLTNATTAAASTKDGHRIHVTFWSAPPPSLSYFTVHCPDLNHEKFAHMPRIIATDGSLALIRVTICPMYFSEEAKFNEYFIYDAAKASPPSLEPLPSPSSCREVFPDRRVGLMRRSDGGFFVAALNQNKPYQRLSSSSGKHNLILHLYDSTNGEWEIKVMDIVDSVASSAAFTFASKVINIGGRSGSMGWVDLWKGILIYDMFVGNNVLRYIPLPLPPPWVHRVLLKGCAVAVRDVVAVNGSINYFEMYPHFSHGWIARTSTWKMDSCSSSNWQDRWNFKASELRMDNPLHLKLLHDLQGDEAEDQSPLLNLHAGHPALSLQHDDGDVVYILLRAVCMDEKGCLLVIDMRNKTVREVVDCSGARTGGFRDVYRQSRISKHLYRNKPTPAKVLCVELHKQSSNNPWLTAVTHGRKRSQGEHVMAGHDQCVWKETLDMRGCALVSEIFKRSEA